MSGSLGRPVRCRVAVRLESDAVRDAAGSKIYQAAEELLSSGRLGKIIEVGGGGASSINNGDNSTREVWVASCQAP
jgi:hypothetical protein